MKVKELIRQLQEADPTGEIEVVADNVDILFAALEPGYYDGAPQLLIRDESLRGCYNVTGATWVGRGMKVQLHPHSIDWMLLDNPEAPVEIDETNASGKELVEKWRNEARELNR
jgi:hypothetical protein